MATEIQSVQDVQIAVFSGVLNDAEGQELLSLVMQAVPKGGKLIIEGTGITGLDQSGLVHLMAVRGRTVCPERKRLPLAGLSPAIWQIIASNGGDSVFDNRPTLNSALGVFGISTAPADGAATPAVVKPSASEGTSKPRGQAPAEDDIWHRRTPASEAPTVPPPIPDAQAASSRSSAGPSKAASDAQWAAYRRPEPAAAKATPGARSKLPIILAVAAVLILLGVGAWWYLAHRAPEITVSISEITAEEGGKEVDEVVVDVRRGRLEEVSWTATLPDGLHFDALSEESDNPSYTLSGRVNPGGKSATVQLVAESRDKSKKSAPVAFNIKVVEKRLSWQLAGLQSLNLKVGEPIKSQSKFLTGTSSVPTATGLPSGLKIEAVPGAARDWKLAGTPTEAGSFKVQFSATSGSAPEAKSIDLQVATAVPPPPAPDAPPAPSPDPAPASQNKPVPANFTAKPGPETNVDDGMRQFLLTRIESLPSRYTEEDRENLRTVVNGLTRARLLHRVIFERDGQREVSEGETARLKAAIQSPENAELLKLPGCQIIVVGYASKSGRIASNVRVSKARALAVDGVLQSVLGRNADLCGDYGPTDVLDSATENSNRAVEIYAGTMEVPAYLKPKAESFKQEFNRRHGAR